jgi:hypothetical protein
MYRHTRALILRTTVVVHKKRVESALLVLQYNSKMNKLQYRGSGTLYVFSCKIPLTSRITWTHHTNHIITPHNQIDHDLFGSS